MKFGKIALVGILAGILSMILSGCGDSNGPKKITYDRDTCARCKMMLSDPSFGAQIVDTKSGKHYNFDDIGCAVLWLEQNAELKDKVVIYVADAESDELIEAKKAHWLHGAMTPMNFGYAAYKTERPDAVSYDEMAAKIMEQYERKQGEKSHTHHHH